MSHNQRNWVDKLDMTEFTINTSVSSTTGYALFNLNYGYMPSMIREIRGNESAYKGVRNYAEQALVNLAEAHNAIIKSQVFQTKYVNMHRKEEPNIKIGDLVFLSTENLNLLKG